MAISNVTVLNTYMEWMVKTNQLIVLNNLMTEGQHNTSGTIRITGGGLSGNVSLNVANGLIRGDGGLIANVRNASLDANSLNVVSNSASITVVQTNSGRLGSKVFLTLAPLSTSATDTSASNIASAQLTNYISVTSGAAFTKANDATITAASAFATANAAAGSGVAVTAAAAYGQANSATTTASAAYGKANTASLEAGGAHAQANTANARAIAAFTQANTASLQAGGAHAMANTVNITAAAAFTSANRGNALGQHTMYIPAGAITPKATGGPALGTYVSGTNGITTPYLAFDASSVEKAYFTVQMPKSWDRGPIVPKYSWMHDSTTVNFGVTWSLAAVARSDNETMDVAVGSNVQVSDTGGTRNNYYRTAEAAGVTVSSVNEAEELVIFEVARQPANTNDTMTIDAWLLGVKLHYEANTANDS